MSATSKRTGTPRRVDSAEHGVKASASAPGRRADQRVRGLVRRTERVLPRLKSDWTRDKQPGEELQQVDIGP